MKNPKDDKPRTFLKDKPYPLIGYMCEPDMVEDGEDGHWDAYITSHDPTGANLAWLNPIKMIEYSAYEKANERANYNAGKLIELEQKIAQLEAEQKAFEKDAVKQYDKDQTEINRLRNVLAKSRIEQQEEIDRLREALEFYANKDNWDDDQFTPTVWDDGAVDLGKRARKALGK